MNGGRWSLKAGLKKKIGKYSIHNIKYIRYMCDNINTTNKKSNKKKKGNKKVVK
jgi:hypothetical protein